MDAWRPCKVADAATSAVDYAAAAAGCATRKPRAAEARAPHAPIAFAGAWATHARTAHAVARIADAAAGTANAAAGTADAAAGTADAQTTHAGTTHGGARAADERADNETTAHAAAGTSAYARTAHKRTADGSTRAAYEGTADETTTNGWARAADERADNETTAHAAAGTSAYGAATAAHAAARTAHGWFPSGSLHSRRQDEGAQSPRRRASRCESHSRRTAEGACPRPDQGHGAGRAGIHGSTEHPGWDERHGAGSTGGDEYRGHPGWDEGRGAEGPGARGSRGHGALCSTTGPARPMVVPSPRGITRQPPTRLAPTRHASRLQRRPGDDAGGSSAAWDV